jgi:hypothetical protein
MASLSPARELIDELLDERFSAQQDRQEAAVVT